MIPISTFNILILCIFALVLYSWIDHRNKLYGNIAAAIVASMMGILMAILIYIGAVKDELGDVVADMPTAGMLLFVSIVIAIYAFFMVMEAKEEFERVKEGMS